MPKAPLFGGYQPSARPAHPDPHRPAHAPLTQRYEEEFAQRHTNPPDYARLPSADALLGMELAWRQLAVDTETSAGEVRRRLGWALVAGLVFGWVVLLSPLRPSPQPLVVGSLWALTAFGLAFVGSEPLKFYYEWLYTYPRLTPATRKARHRSRFTAWPYIYPSPMRLAATALGISLLAPRFFLLTLLAVSIAIVWGLLIEGLARRETRSRGALAAKGREYPARRRLNFFGDVLPLYISHGESEDGPARVSPGVWRYPRPCATRHNDIFWPTFLLVTTLAVSFSFGVTADTLPYLLADRSADLVRPILEAARHRPFGWFTPLYERDSDRAVVLLLAAAAFPIAGSYGLFLFLFGPALARLARLEHDVERDDGIDATDTDATGRGDARPEMRWHMDRTRQSTHTATLPGRGGIAAEKHHLFLGENPTLKHPILLDEELLARHAYLNGSTGSGKTHLGMLPLMLQLLGPKGDPDNPDPPPPLVVVDLKGDWAMFHTLRHEVPRRWWVDPRTGERRQQAFRFFSLEQGRATDYFNPFRSLQEDAPDATTPAQLANILLDVFNLNHGSGYGRGYYSEVNRSHLYDYLQRIRQQPDRWRNLSFAEMARECSRPAGERGEGRNPLELIAHITALAECEQLCTPWDALPPAAQERAILMPRLLEERQVAYFWLPVSSGSRTTRDVALFVLWALWTAAQRRHTTHPVYLFIDELQRVVSAGFSQMMTQARDPANIRLVSSSQSPAQLNTPGEDFRDLIITNAAVRYVFQMSDMKEVERLITFSGTHLEERYTFSQTQDPTTGAVTPGISTSLARVARLTMNEILDVNRDPHRFFLEFTGPTSGYTQFRYNPVTVEADFVLDRAVFEERRRPNTWPPPVAGQLVPTNDKSDFEAASKARGDRANTGTGAPSMDDFETADSTFEDRYKAFEEKMKRT